MPPSQKSPAMSRRLLVKLSLGAIVAGALALALGCSSKPAKATEKPVPVPPAVVVAPPAPQLPPEKLPPVMLGIDVLEADGFKAIAGKKIALLTHPAGVNRRGESTLNVLRRAPQSKLVALFAPEHGFEGQLKASANFGDSTHIPTGLPVYSLHGANRKPTAKQLQGLDAFVIDLQDIGSRSYTFSVVMRYAMAACFQYGVEVIVLDRPNPLGGLKVDGPPLDPKNWSGVGAYPHMHYVHGLTIGEIALMLKHGSPAITALAASSPLAIPEAARAKGKLTVIPMRGWTRNMRWPDTGLRWIPTSPLVASYEAVVGYAMVGLGCEQTAWRSGIGREFPFRGISYPKKSPDEIIAAMSAYKIPGIRFVKREGVNAEGKPVPGVYVEVSDWDAWNPTELSLYMHKQAARWERLNPFAGMPAGDVRAFKIHVGSNAWFAELQRAGGRIDVPMFLKDWSARASIYREQTRKFRLYPWNDAPGK
jgi:uncharacterized protein YbbC (DUF1343 family)